VSSRLSSGSGRYGSSLECAFLRSFGLDDTQHDVLFPMSTGVCADKRTDDGRNSCG